MKIHHFAIEVKNIDVSIDFYEKILGFKQVRPKTTSQDGMHTSINLDMSGAEINKLGVCL